MCVCSCPQCQCNAGFLETYGVAAAGAAGAAGAGTGAGAEGTDAGADADGAAHTLRRRRSTTWNAAWEPTVVLNVDGTRPTAAQLHPRWRPTRFRFGSPARTMHPHAGPRHVR